MSILAPIALCFALFIIVFIVFALTIPEIKIRYEFWASLLGLVAVLPVAFTEYVILSLPIFNSGSFVSVIVVAFIFNGLIEESLKMITLLFLPSKKLNLPSFFCCCMICGLAFGSFESVVYMLVSLQKMTSGTGIIYKLVVSRLFSAVIIHTLCTSLSGLYIWTFRKKKTKIFPFILAVTLHGLYNFFASYPVPFYYFIIPVILFAALECRIRYQLVNQKI